jgi:hypothetical protein
VPAALAALALALAPAVAAAPPPPAILAVRGLACVHRDPWVCAAPPGRIAFRLTLSPAAAASVARGWSFSETATHASMSVAPAGGGTTFSLLVRAAGEGEVDLLVAGRAALVLYVGPTRLPPWPGTPRLADPRANLPAPPLLFPPSPAAQERAYLAAIDRARLREGLGAMRLPRDFASLTPVEELFVLTNLERTSRGLWPLWGISAALDGDAAAGARAHADPVYRGGVAWGSNWASGTDPAQAMWGWMYADGPGPGGENLDCPPGGGGGCWGHRHNVLGQYGPYGLFGGAAVAGGGTTELMVTGYAPPAAGVVYTWAQAVAAGAQPAD